MINIDSTAELQILVKRHPFLAKLTRSMCSLLEQVNDYAQRLYNSDDANLGHLEESLRKPMGNFLLAVLEQAAQQKADAVPPKCPKCGGKLIRRQKLERTIRTGFGEIKLTRIRGYCRKCKEWFCPADEVLGIESGYSPHAQEMAALFASKMPIGEASAVLERATGMKMAPATLDRMVKQAGQKAQGVRKERDEQARQGGELLARQSVEMAPETLLVMMDCWNIRERDDWGQTERIRQKGEEPKRWHWVWTGTVFGLKERVQKSDRAMILQRGYVATRQGMEEFTEQLHAEALRQGLGKAKRVVVMADGAVWIWKLAGERFKEAVQRVDIYHVKQHLWVVAKALYPDPEQAKLWVRKMKNLLRRSQAAKVITSVEQAVKELGKGDQALEREINYLKENQPRMDYASGIRRGEPIGSGAMESTCRQYQCRLKRTGQFWTPAGDEAVMCLETFWRNQRWSCLFPHISGFDPSKN